ncbi:ADAM family of metalloprotease-like protein ADM-B [Xylogone sp. PMI_703]|nr:ADAM family of metalloprotease-like protein ADM-B [Xylogone sp. PMI_703]
MKLFSGLITAVLGSACLWSAANAHSTERNPLTYLTLVDDPTIHTPSHRVHAWSKFDLTFDLHARKQKIKLTLDPNHGVIAEGATISHLAADGTVHSHEPINRADYRVFKGQAWLKRDGSKEWMNVGWARIMVHEDGARPLFEGAFKVDGNHHHIQMKSNYMKTKHALDPKLEDGEEEYMVLWRDSDVAPNFGDLHGELKRDVGEDINCNANLLEFNTNPEHPVYQGVFKPEEKFWGAMSPRSLYSRQIDGTTSGNGAGVNLVSTIGNSAGCPTSRRVALVGVATDCTYTEAFNGNKSAAQQNIINVFNTASVQYENSFNITLGLANVTISDPECPTVATAAAPWNIGCSQSVGISDRLNLFSGWRGARPDNNAYWTLLSTCADGSAVGLSWLGQACVNTAQVAPTAGGGNETVSGANVVVRTSTEWLVVAHESGHTFGAVHDCDASVCANATLVAAQQCCPLSASTCDAGGQYIMNPSTGPNIQIFSPCTVGNICSAIGRNSVNTKCLTANKDVTTITGSSCGNGIVEPGEDCDCGGDAGCAGNTCCDASTCKFIGSAVCDPSNEDCCNSQCQFASNGTVCRASTGSCDPEEVCTGTAATCPTDVTAPDGTSCGNDLNCASGQCTSRDLQCKVLMGSYTQGNDTYACSSNGCQISCASPEFGSNVCYSMQQNFLDGTPCQGGGKCNNGQCQGSSVAKEIKSWIDDHKPLVIGLAAGVGSLLILIILSCCISRYRRKRRIAQYKAAHPPQGWNGPPPQWTPGAPPLASRGGYWDNGQWIPPQEQVWTGPSVRYG